MHIKRNGSRGKIGIFWQMKMIELQYETANGLLVKNTNKGGGTGGMITERQPALSTISVDEDTNR